MKIKHSAAREMIKRGSAMLLCAALCAGALLFSGGCSTSGVRVGNLSVETDVSTLDARGAQITDIEPILSLTGLLELDIRDNEISAEDYARIHTALPGCVVRWSVPVSGARFDSESETLALPSFSEADIAMLAYFPKLTSVDASGSTDYAALRQAVAAWPRVTFEWTVEVSGQTLPRSTEALDLSNQTVDTDALLAALPGLTGLLTVDLRGTQISAEALAALTAARPDVRFETAPELFGTVYDSLDEEVDLSGMEALDVDALIEGLHAFTALARVKLYGCTLTNEQRAALMAAYPDVTFLWTIELLPGLLVDSADTEAVVTDKNPDTQTLLQNLAYLPNLEKLDMTACYEAGDETNALMETLMAACPDVKFVWLVHIGNWEIRTDIEAFSMGNQKTFPGGRFLGGSTYGSVHDDTILPLKYCTDLIALDMGHAKHVTDVSCIAGLTKIRYLILGMMSLTSLEPLSGMTELEFLECYQNWITDLSPLLNCKKLKYLNCSTTFVDTIDDIVQMTQLKRLWIMKQQVLTKDDIAKIKEALPNTIVRSQSGGTDHSTTWGWRTKNPAYLYMQGVLYDLPIVDQELTKVGDPEYWDWDLEAFEQE